jgi:hypothetical protein
VVEGAALMTRLADSVVDSIVISTFRTREDNRPRQLHTSWPAVVKSLTRHLHLVDKHSAALWSPARFARGSTRKKEAVEQVSVGVFDVDDGTDASTVEYWLGDLEYVIVSTFSHTPNHPKLRVIIRLAEPIPLADFDQVWRRANQHLMHGHVDPSTKDASRMFYRPSCPPNAEPVAVVHVGQPLDWRALPGLPVLKAMPRRTPAAAVDASDDHKRASSMLAKWERELAGMPSNSGRHNRLLELAHAAGGLVASGLLIESEVVDSLNAACRTNGLETDDGQPSVQKTIADGLQHGRQAPWTPDDLPDSPNWRASRRFHRTARGVVDTDTGEVVGAADGIRGADQSEDATGEDRPSPELVLPAAPKFPVAVLPPAARTLVNESSLPAALLAGPVLATLLAACGDRVEVEYSATQIERPIALIVNVAPKSAGKSPSQRIGLQPLVTLNRGLRADYQADKQRWQERSRKDRGERPANPAFIRKRITPEGLLRDLAKLPAILACPDELEATLRDLAGYRVEDSQSSGLSILLELWTGEPQDYTRVGRSDGEHNAVELYIDRPTLVLVGGLQTVRHGLLGPIEDGIRPRWLVHLAERPPAGKRRDPSDDALAEYAALITCIFKRRAVTRRWRLDTETRSLFDVQVLDWKRRAASNDVNDSVAAALDKADANTLKIVCALAEAMLPALPDWPMQVEGEPVLLLGLPRQAMLDAIAWMEFILDCWACLEGGTPLARSQRERAVIDAANRVMDYVDIRGVPVTGNVLRNNRVGGVQTSDQLHEVLDMIDAMFPGLVERIPTGSRGGRPSRVVHPRLRRVLAGTHENPETAPEGTHENPETADSAEFLPTKTSDFTHENPHVYPRKPPSTHENLGASRSHEAALNLKSPAVDEKSVVSSCARARIKENFQDARIDPSTLLCRKCGEPLRQVHQTRLQLHDDCTLPWAPSA